MVLTTAFSQSSLTEIHGHKVDGVDFPRVYFEYQDYLRRSREIDYDDQMVFTHRIFRQYPDIIDAVDGILPSADEDEELEEERRLFYVGTIRAKTRLEFLCYEKKFGEASDAAFPFVSQFLGEEPKKEPEPAPSKPAGPSKEQIAAWMKDYIPGTEVTHKIFGRGLVRKREGNFAVISFREVGDKKLALVTCLRQDKIRLTYFV